MISSGMLILSVIFKSLFLFLLGVWLLVQLSLVHLPCISHFAKLILAAASTFLFAVFYLVIAVYNLQLV